VIKYIYLNSPRRGKKRPTFGRSARDKKRSTHPRPLLNEKREKKPLRYQRGRRRKPILFPSEKKEGGRVFTSYEGGTNEKDEKRLRIEKEGKSYSNLRKRI